MVENIFQPSLGCVLCCALSHSEYVRRELINQWSSEGSGKSQYIRQRVEFPFSIHGFFIEIQMQVNSTCI